MTQLFVGIDIGTFESKGVLVDRSGVVLARARHRHGVSTPAPGFVEHDADAVWWHDFCAISRELMESPAAKSAEIAGIACSGIGPCVLPVDAELRPLRLAILYGVDTRATAQIDELVSLLGEEAILAKGGNALTSQSAGPKIAWIVANEPEIAARTRWYLTSQSYLVARLTGRVTMDHGTAGYFHPLYDLARQRWDVTGLEHIVRPEQLPELGWASEIAGAVTAEAALSTGLPVGTPVTFGSADAPAEAVAASVVATGDLMLMYGSSGYMIRVLDAPLVDPVLWSAPFVFPGTFVLAAGTSTAGTVTRWACELLDIDARQGDDAMFAELVRVASDSPAGARGLLMLPHLSGERTPVHDPHSRGVLLGLSLAHGRAEFARAAIEGVAHSLAHALSAYDAQDAAPKRIVAIGGGVKNPILIQAVSDLTGFSQLVAESDGASFGDAAIAALATGHLAGPDAVAAWAVTSRTILPKVEGTAQLRRDHADYLDLYNATAPLQQRRTTSHHEQH